MIRLENQGSAYDIGFQHGSACPEAASSAYEAWFGRLDLDPAEAGTGVSVVEDRLRRHFPEMLEEMEGIADGSGLSYRQVLELNCFDTVTASGPDRRCCSTIGFLHSDVGVLLGKTADWDVSQGHRFATWQRYRPEEGYRFIHYGCAGTLWTEGGLNEAGLGMVLNGLPVGGDSNQGVPWVPLTRGVLQHCASVPEALQFLEQYDVMCWGVNLMLADAGGDLAFVEVIPGKQAVCRPEEDYLIHTNHCLCADPAGRQLSDEALAAYGEPGLPRNSKARYDTLNRIVPLARRSRASMKDLLRDRSPSGPISQQGEDGMWTVYAMVVAPMEGKIWGAEGFPPGVPFVEYQVL